MKRRGRRQHCSDSWLNTIAKRSNRAALAAAEDAARWREAFVRYLRTECHLAENSVLAYERDLRRFFDWLRGRRIEGLTVSELSGLSGMAHGAGARAGVDQPARRVAEGVFPLPAAGRRAHRQPGRAAGHAKALAARADRAVELAKSTRC